MTMSGTRSSMTTAFHAGPTPHSAASGAGEVHAPLAPLLTLSMAMLVVLAAAGGIVAWHGLWPGRLSLATVRTALVGPRVVAITVDDGPTATYTPQVLALLKHHGATATFFVIGRNALKYPELVRAEIAQGGIIGVHTWSHPKMDRISPEHARAEVLRGMQAVQQITGTHPLFYRPPRGVLTPVERQAVAADGMRTVLWDECLDHAADKSAAAAAARVMARIRPGDIILLHDGAGHRQQTMQALDILLDELRAHGYRVVPLSQLPL
jgi:peptidoglycan/xylan/chitin deacetylase (PgdA/CDA1 family)